MPDRGESMGQPADRTRPGPGCEREGLFFGEVRLQVVEARSLAG